MASSGPLSVWPGPSVRGKLHEKTQQPPTGLAPPLFPCVQVKPHHDRRGGVWPRSIFNRGGPLENAGGRSPHFSRMLRSHSIETRATSGEPRECSSRIWHPSWSEPCNVQTGALVRRRIV